jgi:putrescine transport system ATP-binding protein
MTELTADDRVQPLRDTKTFLQTIDLLKRFDDVVAVDHVNLSIERGEIFALLGSSGCGKSTLLRMLAGFETPTAGRGLLGGVDMVNIPPHERPVNMMFQSYALFPHLSVWENVAFGLRREGLPKDIISARVADMLDLVQLGAYATRKPHQLSGGQQQRVALARSLAKKPKLLLLDEPLGALDKKLREETQFELVNIIESVEVTCVMVTHDQEEAMAMASRIAVMSDGNVLQTGAPQEVYEYPNCRFVADFIGQANLFDGRLSREALGSSEIETTEGVIHINHAPTGYLGQEVSVAVRPEKINISKQRPDGIGQNIFTGKVLEIAYFGSYSTFVVVLPSGKQVKVTEANHLRFETSDITWEDGVFFWWPAEAAVVLDR